MDHNSGASHLRARPIWEHFAVVLGNVPPCRNPNILLFGNVLHELSQTLRAAWLSGNARVHWDCHHLTALSVQAIKCIFEILKISVTSGTDEAWRHVELPIVTFRLELAVLPRAGQVDMIAYSHNCKVP
jgi:hypothetical protein